MAEQQTFLDRVKVQAEVLVPVVRKLREELGDERARALVRAALAPYGRALGEQIDRQYTGGPIEKIVAATPMFTAGDALEIEPLEHSATRLCFNVRRCRYAQFFEEIGAREFGELLVCDLDYPMTEGIGAGLELARTGTIMGGADHCDFRWSVT